METPYQSTRHCRASALTLLPGVSPGFGRRGDIIFTTWPPGLESPRTRRVFRVAAFLIRNFFSVISGPLAAGAAGGKQAPGVSPGFGRRGDIIFTTWPPGLESPRTRRVFRVTAFLIRNFFSVISGPLTAGAAGGKQVLALPISTRTAQFFPSAKRGCFPAAFIGEAMRTSLGFVEAFAAACTPTRQPSLTSPRYKAISLNPI